MKATSQTATTILLLAVFGSLAFADALATDAPGPTEADYEAFAEDVLDPEFPDAKVRELVMRGLSNGEPRIVELTVRAIGEHAVRGALHTPVVTRSFSLVPGLHGFLTDYWRDELADFIGGGVEYSGGVEYVPLILATHFPPNDDLYRMIWEFHAHSGSAFATLLALNAGRYTTREADRLRMDSLTGDDILAFAAGALGIVMSKPKGGLEAVVSSLKHNPLSATMPVTKVAIRAYGRDALPVLRDALEAGDLPAAAASVVSGGIEALETGAATGPYGGIAQ